MDKVIQEGSLECVGKWREHGKQKNWKNLIQKN